MSFITDTATFAKKIVIVGADPSHTSDLKQLGGEFHCYLGDKGRGWVFATCKEPVLKEYLRRGVVPGTAYIASRECTPGLTSETGMCTDCKQGTTCDAAVKDWIACRTGGLPYRLANELLGKEYAHKITRQLGSGVYKCPRCADSL